MTGQFWFSEFIALLFAMGFGLSQMGVTSGNLKSQIPLVNGRQKAVFFGVFFIASVVLNLVMYSLVELLSLAGLV